MDALKSTLTSTGIFQLTLNRPDKLNALNQSLLESLNLAFGDAKTNPQIKAILLTGEGEKAFCAGADINRLAEVNPQEGYEFARYGQQVMQQLSTLGKPSLAAINGYTFGGGLELAMATTLRMASTTATFGQPEIKLGIIPGYGGTQRLARLVGKGRALDLCLTGRTISASDALQWGLVNSIVEPAELLTSALAFLNSIIELAPLAIKSIIETIETGYDLPLPEALAFEALHFGLTCATQDKQEGVNAFLTKRKAQFIGK